MTTTCVQYGDAVICGVTVGRPVVSRRVMDCPVCKRRRRFTSRYSGAWYAGVLTCVGCGDSWSDGELMERPFRRGWRAEAIARARQQWNDAMTPQEYRQAIRADLDETFAIEATFTKEES